MLKTTIVLARRGLKDILNFPKHIDFKKLAGWGRVGINFSFGGEVIFHNTVANKVSKQYFFDIAL